MVVDAVVVDAMVRAKMKYMLGRGLAVSHATTLPPLFLCFVFVCNIYICIALSTRNIARNLRHLHARLENCALYNCRPHIKYHAATL